MPETDEDILRELLHRATDDVHAPSGVSAGIVSRHRRRLRSTRILSIATTSVAAAAVVAAVAVPRSGSPAAPLPPARLTAVQVLSQLSVAAARAPQPAGRYVALTENDQYYQRTVIFDSLTGDVWAYQHGGDVPTTFPVSRHWSPTRVEFAAWPTNPVRLRDLLISQGNQAGADSEEGVQSETVPGTTHDDLVFQEATSWLWNPLLTPALRSAMYKVLAATPGVRVKTGTTDTMGRPAIEISRWDSTTFESPATGAVLEQNFPLDDIAVYVKVTGYASLPADPYRGAP